MTMTTDQQHKGNGNGNGKPSLGAQAAAVAASQVPELAHSGAEAPAMAQVAEAAGAADEGDEDDEDDDKSGSKRVPKKVYIVIGNVHEFKNNREAEKFLNDGEAPSNFRVIKGNELMRRQRVALG